MQICPVIFALLVFTVYVAGTGHDAPNGHRIEHVSRFCKEHDLRMCLACLLELRDASFSSRKHVRMRV
jgi:hypothetical protein